MLFRKLSVNPIYLNFFMINNSHYLLTNSGGIPMFQKKMIMSIIVLMCFYGFSFAQSKTKVGIGIAIIDMQQIFEAQLSGGGYFSSTITVPINASSTFRVEPELGFAISTDEFKSGSFTDEETTSSWKIGVGLFGLKKFEIFTLYYGGRVGFLTQSVTEDNGTDTDEMGSTGFYLAPALGGEHYFSDHFSLGGEAQIVYTSIATEPEDGDWEQNLSVINTRVLVFVRFFF